MPDWSWQDFAACRGEDLVLFFGREGERQPERDVREQKAKAICAQCPVSVECLNYALTRPEKYGVWLLNEDERASERRRRQRRGLLAAEPAEAPTKTCSRCREDWPETDYYPDRRASDGLAHTCKHCLKEARLAGQSQEAGVA